MRMNLLGMFKAARRSVIHGMVGALLLTAVCAPAAEAAEAFPDVDANRYGWALGSIGVMAEQGILTGYPDGRFRPDQSVSRAEWSVMMHRLFDKYRPNQYAIGLQRIGYFADVPETYWAYEPILDMYDASFHIGGFGVNASGELAFGPDVPLTRIQLAQILYSSFGQRLMDRRLTAGDACSYIASLKDIPLSVLDEDAYAAAQADGRYARGGFMNMQAGVMYTTLMLDKGDGCVFGEDPLSTVQAYALASLAVSGIMSPTEGGYFRPLDEVSRAEAVTILDRIYLYLRSKEQLADYSTVRLADRSDGGTNDGGGTAEPEEPAEPGASGSGDLPDKNGIILKNVLRSGEVNTLLLPGHHLYLLLDLQSDWKTDLYVELDGQIGFLRQEELPVVLPVSDVSEIRLRTQQRERRPGAVDNQVKLTAELRDTNPETKKR